VKRTRITIMAHCARLAKRGKLPALDFAPPGASISSIENKSMLDRPLPRWARVLLLIVCALVPTAFAARQYARQHDFTPLIFFGEMFASRELPEVKALHPALQPGPGYDGQFYAQMALDPTLRRPDIPAATDGIAYRAQRIFLPALAWLLGAGQPRLILSVYALLNVAFFYALLAAVARRLPAVDLRRMLVLYAIMLGSGVIASVEYAVTDLPCATLGFLALAQGEVAGGLLFACAILTKPTGVLFLAGRLAPVPRWLSEWLWRAGGVAIALVPAVLWQAFLNARFGPHVDKSQVGWPLAGWAGHLLKLGRVPHAMAFPWRDHTWLLRGADMLELGAMLSVTVQAVFLLARPRWREPLWLVGAAFAILFLCLSEKNFGNAADYTRTIIPMTIAFNFSLLGLRTTRVFLAVFVAGNIGMLGGLGEMIFVSFH